MPSLAFFVLIPPDQHHGYVVDVGAGGAGHQQAVHRPKGVVGVVILQGRVDGDATLRQLCRGGAVGIAAGGVGGAVGAVGAQGEDRRAAQSGDALCRGQGNLLVSSAQPLSCDVDHRLAAGQKGQGFIRVLMAPGDGRQKMPRLPGLAGETVGEHHRLIAQLPAYRRRGAAQLPHAAGDQSGHVAQRLGGLLVQMAPGRRGEGEGVFLRNGPGIGAGAAVGIGRSGGDHVQGIADHVREHHGEHLCRGAVGGKASALHGGEPLADGVDLGDIRPAGQELSGDMLQLLRIDQRCLKEGAAAAGQEKQHRVLGAQSHRQIQRLPCGGKAALIRDGMPRLPDLKIVYHNQINIQYFLYHINIF